MSDNFQKTPFGTTLNQTAQRRALDQIQITGKALPAQIVARLGAIVQVSFQVQNPPFTLPNVTIPVAIWKYIRPAFQVGDFGIVVPSDAYLGGISGLGGGVANLTRRANLSALVFVPVSNTAWATLDPNANVLSAPNGAIIQDDSAASRITVLPDRIILQQGTSEVFMHAGTIAFTNVRIEIDGHDFYDHRHTLVMTGPDDTGPVDPAT